MAINGLAVWGGVIDSTYRGEVACIFFNSNPFEWSLGANQKIVQGLLMSVPEVDIVEVDELSETERGQGGFGSTNDYTQEQKDNIVRNCGADKPFDRCSPFLNSY